MRRTKQQAAETRLTILDAAADLFGRHGYDSVSLDQIAAASGVKRGAVHFHFVNKPGVLLAMCEREREPMVELIARLEDDSVVAPLDNLLIIMSGTLRSLTGDLRRQTVYRAALTLAFMGDDEGRALIRASIARVLGTTRQVIDTVARRGQLAERWTAQSATLAVHSAITGIIVTWATSGEETYLAQGVVVLQHLVDSLRKAPAEVPPKRKTLVKRAAKAKKVSRVAGVAR